MGRQFAGHRLIHRGPSFCFHRNSRENLEQSRSFLRSCLRRRLCSQHEKLLSWFVAARVKQRARNATALVCIFPAKRLLDSYRYGPTGPLELSVLTCLQIYSERHDRSDSEKLPMVEIDVTQFRRWGSTLTRLTFEARQLRARPFSAKILKKFLRDWIHRNFDNWNFLLTSSLNSLSFSPPNVWGSWIFDV